MSTAASALPRRLELSQPAFRRLAWFTVAFLILIVATGATVRLTGSGLGCEHWPGCAPGQFIPKKGYHSAVEFSNRVIAFLTVVTTLALALAATRMRALPGRTKLLSWLVFAGTLGQAPLGAVTVYFHLNPYLVIAHLLLSLAVLGIGVVVALDGERAPLPFAARGAGLLLLAAVTFLVVTGTLATAAGKFPGSNADERVRRLGSFQPSVALHVRAVVAFGVAFLILAAWAWQNRERHRWLLPACGGLLGLLALQMGLGETQYRLYDRIPWWVVLLHVTVAAGVFAWTIGLVHRLWRN